MKIVIFFTGGVLVGMSAFSSVTSADTEFFDSKESKELFTGETTSWEKLNNGRKGNKIYHSDGTYNRARTFTSADTEFLDSNELKELLTGKTISWKKLKTGRESINIYHPDGTYSRVKTWGITEDAYKCNYGGKKERCLKIYKQDNEYIGVSKEGKKLYKFTAKSNTDGKEITINTASGKFLSSEEVKKLYSGNTTTWVYLPKYKEGKTTYNTDGTYTSIGGTWKITNDGFKCQMYKRNNKEYCGKIYKKDSQYFFTNTSGERAVYSFTVNP